MALAERLPWLHYPVTVERWVAAHRRAYRLVEASAWALAIYVQGLDTGTTLMGLAVGLEEQRALAAWFLQVAGPAGMVLHKLLGIAVLAVGWRYVLPPPYRLLFPLLLGVQTVPVVLGNLHVG